jgi:exopolysaccharide biosynthesis protein
MVRSSLTQVRIRLIRAAEFGLERAEVRTLCRLARASACINASFFDESGQPLGLLVSRGVLLQPLHRTGRTLTGVLKITRAGVDVVPRSEFQMANVLEALQAGPRLVVDGSIVPGLESSARSGRSAVCRDAQNRVILASSSAGFRGLTLKELQTLLLHPKVNCVSALNLDGGGSAQIFIAPRDSSTSRTSVVVANNGFDPIPVALGLFEE